MGKTRNKDSADRRTFVGRVVDGDEALAPALDRLGGRLGRLGWVSIAVDE